MGMPGNLMVEKINAVLAGGSVAGLKDDGDLMERLARPGSLLEVARDLLDLTDEDHEYLEAIPPAVRDAIRAAIHAALEDGRPVHVSFHPSYDFEARVFDYVTAVGIELHGPYTLPAPRSSYTYKS